MCWQCPQAAPGTPEYEAERKQILEASDRFALELEKLAEHYRRAARDARVRHNAHETERIRPAARHVLRELFEGWF